jgi:hypothetical protein
MKKSLFIAIILLIILAFSIPALSAPATFTNVSNFSQLKAALENTTTTHIIFTNNINLEKTAVAINPSKSELVIDGAGFTLTSFDSDDSKYTLSLNQFKTLKNITVQNMNIVGYNKNGIVYIPSSTTYSSVTLTYSNITYSGMQLVEARKSNVVFRDCEINLIPLRSKHPSEVAAATHIRLEGTVNIVKNAPGCKMDLFHIHSKGGGLTVASGAVVNVEDNLLGSRPKDWGFVKVPYNSCYIRFEDNSKFTYAGNNVFQKGEEIDNIYIGRNTEVNVFTYGNFFCENGLFAINKLMIIEEGASVNLLGMANGKDKPVIWLDSGGQLVINNPKQVLIYNSYAQKSSAGLAIRADGCAETTFAVKNIAHLEFWSMNSRPSDNLLAPTRAWANLNGGQFSAAVTQKEKKTKTATTSGYSGLTPFNTTTATLNNVNVIRVNGGFAMNEAKIIVICRDAATGLDLPNGRQEHNVPRGAYGPYSPFYAYPDYTFKAWDSTSDPPSGIISVGETKTIVFLYEKATIDIEGIVTWNDFANKNNTRPASVNIDLFRNGTFLQTVSVPSDGDGKFKFVGLPLVDAFGIPYVYTIGQQGSPPLDKYTTAIAGSAATGFIVTNSLILKADIEVTVIWDDYSNVLGLRPATVMVGLFRNNGPFQAQTVPVPLVGNEQKVLFANVDLYSPLGDPHIYTAVQQPTNNFYLSPQISGFTITNILKD